MSISAVVVGHGQSLYPMINQLKKQSRPPDEIIAIYCCWPKQPNADIVVRDIHRGDWGNLGCSIGLQLASKDYVGFFNSDDELDPSYIEKLMSHNEDLIYCDFHSHLTGKTEAAPVIGQITRGAYIIRTEVARKFGYGNTYESDGILPKDIAEAGYSHIRVPETLYYHR